MKGYWSHFVKVDNVKIMVSKAVDLSVIIVFTIKYMYSFDIIN